MLALGKLPMLFSTDKPFQWESLRLNRERLSHPVSEVLKLGKI